MDNNPAMFETASFSQNSFVPSEFRGVCSNIVAGFVLMVHALDPFSECW